MTDPKLPDHLLADIDAMRDVYMSPSQRGAYERILARAATYHARAAVEQSAPWTPAKLFDTGDGSMTHEVGGRMVQDVYAGGALVSRIPVDQAGGGRVTKQMCYRAIDAYTEAVGEGWQQPCVEGMYAALDAAMTGGEHGL